MSAGLETKRAELADALARVRERTGFPHVKAWSHTGHWLVQLDVPMVGRGRGYAEEVLRSGMRAEDAIAYLDALDRPMIDVALVRAMRHAHESAKEASARGQHGAAARKESEAAAFSDWIERRAP